jgi:hypothetical protein
MSGTVAGIAQQLWQIAESDILLPYRLRGNKRPLSVHCSQAVRQQPFLSSHREQEPCDGRGLLRQPKLIWFNACGTARQLV